MLLEVAVLVLVETVMLDSLLVVLRSSELEAVVNLKLLNAVVLNKSSVPTVGALLRLLPLENGASDEGCVVIVDRFAVDVGLVVDFVISRKVREICQSVVCFVLVSKS